MQKLVRSCAGAHSALLAGHRTYHPAAFFCTPAAGLRALLTVGNLELGALVAARFADVGACLTGGANELAATRHIGDRESTDFCAIHVERNTARHRLWVRFLQTGYGAVVASDGAVVTGFDTRLELFMSHGFLHKKIHVVQTN
jgi:hypothetical protein